MTTRRAFLAGLLGFAAASMLPLAEVRARPTVHQLLKSLGVPKNSCEYRAAVQIWPLITEDRQEDAIRRLHGWVHE